MNVAPRGFPTCLSFVFAESSGLGEVELEIEVFSRKSCVTAMPILANDKDVLSHARNVRSVNSELISQSLSC